MSAESINAPREIIAALLQRYDEMDSAMRRLDAQAEANVTRWEWATGEYYSLLPLYHERHHAARGRLLRGEPTKPGADWLFGFDANNQLLTRYNYGMYEEPHIAEFLLYQPDGIEIICYVNSRWSAADDYLICGVERLYGNPQQPERYIRLSALGGSMSIDYEVYHYQADKLIKAQVQHLLGVSKDAATYFETHYITYSADGKPKVTIDNPRRRDLEIALGVVNSGDKAENSVIESLCQTVINAVKAKRVEGVRCWLEIGYDAVVNEGVLIILGRESDRIEFMDQTYDRWFGSLRMHGDSPGRREQDMFQAEWSEAVAEFIETHRENQDWTAVRDLFKDTARTLNEYDWGALIAVTSDFIVFAYDYESTDDMEPYMLDSVPESKIDLWRANGWFS